MRVAVIGVGAIGSLMATRLCVIDDIELLLVTRPSGVHSLVKSGLVLHELDDGMTFLPPNRFMLTDGVDIPIEWRNAADVVIVAVKSYQTEKVTDVISRILGREGVILSLQNGLGNEERIQTQLPFASVLGGMTTHGVHRIGEVETKWVGRGEIVFGPLSGFGVKMDDERLTALYSMLDSGSLNPRMSEVIETEIWKKLLINAAINPLASIAGVVNGELVSIPELKEQMFAILHEAVSVANMAGVPIKYDVMAEQLVNVVESTAGNECSMLADLKAGRPTEIDSIASELIVRGEVHGIPTPLLAQVRALVKAIEVSPIR